MAFKKIVSTKQKFKKTFFKILYMVLDILVGIVKAKDHTKDLLILPSSFSSLEL
jgi:hypothetical protein